MGVSPSTSNMLADGNGMSEMLRRAALATLVVMMLTAVICAGFSGRMLTTWVALFFVAATPAEIVLALLWRAQHPAFVAQLSQPMKGIVLTSITASCGVVIGLTLFHFAGEDIGPPTPMLIMLSMLSVVTTLWLIPVWHCWPVSALTSNQTTLGIGILVASYALAMVLFRFAFNFSFLATTPVYVASLDPGGWLNAWTALSASVTSVAAILVAIQFDFWPVSILFRSRAQPVFGAVASFYVVVIAAALYFLFTHIVGLDPVQHLVRIAVSLIYGIFLVDLMTRHELFAAWGQPRRGIGLTVIAACLAAVIYPLYAGGAHLLTGETMASGAPTYELEIWVATAMLGITFPLMVVIADFFEFWPSSPPPSSSKNESTII
jgi:hypothetical protein